MHAHARPLLVSDLGTDGQSCEELERVPLKPGSGDGLYDEAWLQRLIQEHPTLLPVREIEPGFSDLVPIAMEVQVSTGSFVDNLFLTTDGDIVVVETKLWRNPEARRDVVGQILRYAEGLSRLTFEDLQRAVGAARKEKAVKLFDLVSAAAPGDSEYVFIDAVSRNLRLGRMLLIIAGDGVQEGVEQLAGFLQRHIGLHFTLGLVEMSLWRSTGDGRFLVQPRILARTVQIDRAVIRVETSGAAATIEPVAVAASKATTLTESQYYEDLAQVSPELPGRLKAFLGKAADLNIHPDIKRSLSLKWPGSDGQEYNLGIITSNGMVSTDYANWSAQPLGRIELGHAYQEELAALLPGGFVRKTPKPTGWRAVAGDGELRLDTLLDHEAGWLTAIGHYIEGVSAALQGEV